MTWFHNLSGLSSCFTVSTVDKEDEARKLVTGQKTSLVDGKLGHEVIHLHCVWDKRVLILHTEFLL